MVLSAGFVVRLPPRWVEPGRRGQETSSVVIMSVAACLHLTHDLPIRDTVDGTGFTGRNFLSVYCA
jgi:hypothetical protein